MTIKHSFLSVLLGRECSHRALGALVAFSLIGLQQLGWSGSGGQALAQATAAVAVDLSARDSHRQKLSARQDEFINHLHALSKIAGRFPLEPNDRANMPASLMSELNRQWRMESEKLVDSYVQLDELPPRVDMYVFVSSFLLDREPGAGLNAFGSPWKKSIVDALTCAMVEPLGFAGTAAESRRDFARLDRFCRRATERVAQGKDQYLFERALWGATTFLNRKGRSHEALTILTDCERELTGKNATSARLLILAMSARAYERSGNLARALDCRKHAVSIASAHGGCRSKEYIEALIDLARTYACLKNKTEFHSCWMKACQLCSGRTDLDSRRDPQFLGGPLAQRLASLADCALEREMVEESDRIFRAVSLISPTTVADRSGQMTLCAWYEESFRYEEAESLMTFLLERVKAHFGVHDVDYYASTLLELSALYKRHAESRLGVTPEFKSRLQTLCERCFYDAERCVVAKYKPGTEGYSLALSRYVDNLPRDKATCIKERFLVEEVAAVDDDCDAFTSAVVESQSVAPQDGDASCEDHFSSSYGRDLFQSAACPQGFSQKTPQDEFQSGATVMPRRKHRSRRLPGTRARRASRTLPRTACRTRASTARGTRVRTACSTRAVSPATSRPAAAAESAAPAAAQIAVESNSAVITARVPDARKPEPKLLVNDIFQSGESSMPRVSDPFQQYCSASPKS